MLAVKKSGEEASRSLGPRRSSTNRRETSTQLCSSLSLHPSLSLLHPRCLLRLEKAGRSAIALRRCSRVAASTLQQHHSPSRCLLRPSPGTWPYAYVHVAKCTARLPLPLPLLLRHFYVFFTHLFLKKGSPTALNGSFLSFIQVLFHIAFG